MDEELKFLRNSPKKFRGGGGGVGRCTGWVSQGGFEVFVKIQKKELGGVGGGGRIGGLGVRVDVIEELKFLWKLKKKLRGRWVGLGGGGGGVRVDVNEELNF